MALAIVNRSPDDAARVDGLPQWKTCLREVSFSQSSDDLQAVRGGLRLSDGDAYALLLEILCGLQSPMLGETQVMGQFKTFLASLGREHAWLNRLGQRLLTDAREIRTNHLQGLGSQSYGSAIRLYLQDADYAVLIGTGKLAREVVPFLGHDGRPVDVWGRTDSPELGSVPYTYRRLGALATFSGPDARTTLVVAAPVPSADVDAVAARYPRVSCVVDLRGEAGQEPLKLRAPVVGLDALFARMTAANRAATAHVARARAEIADCRSRFDRRDELRPFGWDDLCA
jgi:glutamyl-tRNA reductase